MTEQLSCKFCGSFAVRNFGRRVIKRNKTAKHILFCEDCGESFSIEETQDAKPIMPKVEEPVSYGQDWQAYNLAKTREKVLFLDVLDELLQQIEWHKAKRVGRPSMDFREIIFCNAVKAYSGLASRRAISEIQLANHKGYINKIWHFNSLLRALSKKELTPILKRLIVLSSLPLKEIESQFAVDASGFSTSQFGRWMDYRYNGDKTYRMWRKCHIIIGTRTNIVTDVKITHGTAADCPHLPELVLQTDAYFDIKEVSADKGYLSRKNMNVIESIGATPFIMFKENSRQNMKGSQIWRKMYKMFCLEPEKFLEHYHRRSNVETSFWMIKQKFGSSVKTKSAVGQENEILLKVLCHNICCLIQEMYETGISKQICTQINKTAPKKQIFT